MGAFRRGQRPVWRHSQPRRPNRSIADGRRHAGKSAAPAGPVTGEAGSVVMNSRRLKLSNSRRVPECARGRLPGGSGLDQGLRSWTASGVSFLLARASAGLADSTIRNDTGHLELIRAWFGRPLWEMQPGDADAYFGRVLRDARPSARTGRAAALTV